MQQRMAGIALLAFALLWFAVPETLAGTAATALNPRDYPRGPSWDSRP
jgi:hypothetical protein